MSIVSLEFNPGRILLVAGRKAAKRPLEVSHAIEIPLEKDITDEEISSKLKRAVADNGLARHDAVVVLSRSQSELREIELPPAPDDELPDMVLFKAKSDFASFNERWLLDFVSLDNDETKPRKVLASAISPEIQKRVEKIVEPTGLKLQQLVLRPFAIMDLLKTKKADERARLVVSPGDNFTDIIVVENNRAVTTRSIRVSPGRSADEKSQQLISEVRRTIASTKRQLGASKIQGLVLLDDEKTNRHLLGDLGERLGLDIEVVNPFDSMQRIGQAKDSIDLPWQYAPLLGSIAHAGGEHAPDIDFLNPTRRQEVVVDRSRWWLFGGLAAMAAVLVVLFGWWTLRQQKAEIAELTRELANKIQENDAEGTRPSVQTKLQRIGKVDQWQKENIQWLDEIDEMSKRFLTADEVMVKNFSAALRRRTPIVDLGGAIINNDEYTMLTEAFNKDGFEGTQTKADRPGNEDYPIAFGLNVTVKREGDDWLKAIDTQAREFQKRAKTPASEGSQN